MTLTGSCYMAQIRRCGSTSAAQALVGRSLAIGISQAVRDVSRVEVFSGSKFGVEKVCDCGSEGCGSWVSGDWRAAKLESWREFCGGARGNAAYRYRMMYHEYHPATAFPLSRDLHCYSTRISWSGAVPFSKTLCLPFMSSARSSTLSRLAQRASLTSTLS